MRVRWATTCEAVSVDERGAHSLHGVGVNVVPLRVGQAFAELPLFACLSVPRHELDTELPVTVTVTAPGGRAIAEETHTVQIPRAAIPSGPMDGYEVPTWLSTTVRFDAPADGAYAIWVTTAAREGDPLPEPLTVFVQRTA